MTAQPAPRSARADDASHPAYPSVSRSHVGRVRTINEDRVLACPEAQLWAVADGMGGHCGGDLAAQTVVDELRAAAHARAALTAADLVTALERANASIWDRNRRLAIDAGATVVAALIEDEVLRIAWAGDSRCYRFRDGQLQQLTHDHSFVQELVDAGLLSPTMADRHPRAHIVTRAIGVQPQPQYSVASTPVRPNDGFLLCSDGLSRSLLATDLENSDNLDQLADRLVSNALARDGSDNISLVLVMIPPG